MNRLRFTVLLLFTATFAIATRSMAEDNPPPPPANPTAQQPPPAPPGNPASDSGQPAPHARKEEEQPAPAEAEASFWARIKAYGSSKTKLAANANTLATQLQERDTRIAQLEAENTRLTADLTRLANWLTEQGIDPKDTAADPAKAFQTAVGAGVANEVRKIGVPVDKLKTRPEPVATTPAGKTPIKRDPNAQAAAVQRQRWAASGYTPPGLTVVDPALN